MCRGLDHTSVSGSGYQNIKQPPTTERRIDRHGASS